MRRVEPLPLVRGDFGEVWVVLGDRFLIPIVNSSPVHHVPPLCQIFGATVLIGEVVGVFPEVVAEDGNAADHERVVLVGG